MYAVRFGVSLESFSFMVSFHRFLRVSVYLAAIAGMTLGLGACQLGKNTMKYDRPAEMSRQDFRDAMAPAKLPEGAQMEATPDFQPVMSTPEELRLPTPLVTVSVNQTVSLRDLMFELADQADVDLEMDPQIRGSIIFTAKDRPFDQVVERISEMAGLRYTFENNVLRLELDRPFVKTYTVDYVGAMRKASSKISTKVEMTSASTSGGGSGSSGSSSSVDTSADGDPWKELQEGLEQILTSSDTYTSLATLSDPVAMAVNPMPPALPTDPNNPQTVPPALPGSPQVAPMAPGVAPTLNVTTPAAEPLVPSPPATYSISRNSGVVSVFASERQQKLVKKFLEEFRKRSSTQVQIEAKILQVDLSDEYAAGINWSEVSLTGMLRMEPDFAMPSLSPASTNVFSGVFEKGDVNVLVQALQRFGTVRALSSPRVTVLNGQPAIVNVAQNNVYFEFDVQTEEDSDTGQKTLTVDSEQRGVPEGVLLNVIPTANPDTGEIMMVVRPTVSKITRFVTDPTIALTLVGNGIDPTQAGVPDNQVPEVSVQEMDSALRLQSGQIMVMGGLMRDTNSVSEEGVPIAAEIPFVGHLFKNHSDKIIKSELVIFIKAQIVNGSNIDNTDRKMYKAFSLDRRPAAM